MAKIASNQVDNSNILTDLYSRLKKQKLLRLLSNVDALFTNEVEMKNKLLEIISMGLPTISTGDWEKKKLEIADFNGTMEKYVSMQFKTKAKLEANINYPYQKLLDAFLKEETATAFVAERSRKTLLAFKMQYLTAEAKLLCGISTTIGGETLDDLVFDFSKEFTAQNTVLQKLQEIRQYILGLQTPSANHTLETAKAGNETFIGSYDASDLIIIWNAKHYNEIFTQTATLFNSGDVLKYIGGVGRKKVLDFSKIKGITKAQADKHYCWILHKDAIQKGIFISWEQVIRLPKARVLDETGTEFTYIRVPLLPIAKFTVATNSSRKK